MRNYILFGAFAGLFLSTPCFTAHALPLSGFAQSVITNLNISFSDKNAIIVERKGIFPQELNGAHAESYASDLEMGIIQTQKVGHGFTTSSIGNAHSSADIAYFDITNSPISDDIYSGVTYSTSAYGATDSGTNIRSYAIINDDWLFNVIAPISVTVSFDYNLGASGEALTSLGYLKTEAFVGLGMGQNNTTSYKTSYVDSDLLIGTITMGVDYLDGDSGNILIWHGADVISTQRQPNPVPEPSSMLLLCTGFISVLAGIFRKKKSAP